MTAQRMTLTVVAIAAALCGCGAAVAPSADVATATGAVRAAQEAGAETMPQAALELRLAQEEMSAAQRMMRDNQMDRAQLELRRAAVDADLARAIARQESSRTEAVAAQTDLQSLEAQR